MTDFGDESAVKTTYCEEVVSVAKQLVGADEVFSSEDQ